MAEKPYDLRLLNQVIAGAADTPGNIVGLYALPRVVQMLRGKEDPGVLPGDDKALQFQQDWQDGVSRVLGIDTPTPDDLDMFGARMGGGAFVGTPASITPKLLQNAPKVVKAGGAAIESVLPMTTPLTPGRVVANTAVPTGAGAVLHEMQKSANAQEADDVVPANVGDSILGGDDDIVADDAAAAIAQDQADNSLFEDIARETRRIVDDWTTGEIIGAAIATTAAAALGARGIRALNRNNATDVTGPLPQHKPLEDSILANAATKFVTDYQDSTYALKRALEINNPGAAQDIIPRIGLAFNESARTDRFLEAMRTGVVHGSKVNLGSFKQWADQISSLDDTRRMQLFDAINAATELDNRKAQLLTQFNTTKASTLKPLRTNLSHLTDAQLEAKVNSIVGDAELVALKAEHKNRMRRAADLLEEQGLITPQEKSKFLSINPNFVHTYTYGGKNPLSPRARGGEIGQDLLPDPVRATEDYLIRILSAMDSNNIRRDAIKALANPPQQTSLPKIVGKIVDQAPDDGRRYVSFIDGGVTKFAEILNDDVRNALNHAPRYLGGFMDMMNSLRKLQQSTQTGLLSAATGAPFAPTSAIYSTIGGSVLRDPGRSMGLVDKALQAASGGRVGFRGDPTALAQAVWAIGADGLAEGARLVGEAVRRSVRENGTLARLLPGNAADALAKRLENAYANSMLHLQRTLGAGASSGFSTADHVVASRSYLSSLSPDYNAVKIVDTTLEKLGQAVTPSAAVKARNFAAAIHDIIANSGHSAFFRQNLKRDMSRSELEKLAYDTRRLVGDPGNVGASGIAQNTAAAVSYANISVQGFARLLEAMKKDPVGTVMGITTAGVLPTLLTIGFLTELGPEAVDWYYNQRSYDEQVSRNVIPIPGVPPQEWPSYGIEPVVRPAHAMALSIADAFFGLSSGRIFAEDNIITRERLKQLADVDDTERLKSAVSQMILGAQTPPALAALTLSPALFGKEGFDSSRMLDVFDPNIIPSNARARRAYEDERLPNDVINNTVEQLANSTFPLVANTLFDVLRAYSFTNEARPGEGASAALDTYALRTKDRNKLVNSVLWEHVTRDTVSTPQSKLLRDKQDVIDQIVTGLPSQSYEGTVGSGQLREGSSGFQFSDVVDANMRDVLMTIGQVYAQVQRNILAEKKLAREQLLTFERDGTLSAMEKRLMANITTQRIREIDTRALDALVDVEDALSKRYGRAIRIEKLDPKKDITQFPALTPAVE
jgi:hypothetical protein